MGKKEIFFFSYQFLHHKTFLGLLGERPHCGVLLWEGDPKGGLKEIPQIRPLHCPGGNVEHFGEVGGGTLRLGSSRGHSEEGKKKAIKRRRKKKKEEERRSYTGESILVTSPLRSLYERVGLSAATRSGSSLILQTSWRNLSS